MLAQVIPFPQDAVALKDGRPVTTSLKVAEAFGKQHDNVLRTIRTLDCSDEFRRLNFEAATYTDAQGKPRPMFELTRDGFTLLGMGFTGPQAARFKEAYIGAFNAMESALLSKHFAPASAPKIEVDAVEHYKMKAELAELKLEKAEAAKKRRRAFTEADKTVMLAMNARGKTPGQIAAELGRTTSAVRTWLRTRS
ncbi:MAG: Rha family transcriptional regulator [Desulfuromonadales bacterium]|nr:Rha family transcriptional regulator [Desulfuromonadales bacterium]